MVTWSQWPNCRACVYPFPAPTSTVSLNSNINSGTPVCLIGVVSRSTGLLNKNAYQDPVLGRVRIGMGSGSHHDIWHRDDQSNSVLWQCMVFGSCIWNRVRISLEELHLHWIYKGEQSSMRWEGRWKWEENGYEHTRVCVGWFFYAVISDLLGIQDITLLFENVRFPQMFKSTLRSTFLIHIWLRCSSSLPIRFDNTCRPLFNLYHRFMPFRFAQPYLVAHTTAHLRTSCECTRLWIWTFWASL